MVPRSTSEAAGDEDCRSPEAADSLTRVTQDADLAVLRRALDQLSALLAGVRPDAAGDPTPCPDWSLQDLVDHVVATPTRFAQMLRSEPVDWSAPTPSAGNDPAGAFRASADDLVGAWRNTADTGQAPPVDWQCGELAVHTWDLATAVHASTSTLDPEVAERGL